MKAHLGLLLLALVAGCGGGATVAEGGSSPLAPVHASPVTFAAGGPWRYRFDRIDSITTTLPNGGRQVQVLERHLVLRWTTTADSGALRARITIDSVDVVGMPGGMGRALEDSARGTVIEFALQPDGAVSTPTITPDNTVARTLSTQLPWLIPALPHSLMPGAERVDTLSLPERVGVVDLDQRTVRRTSVGTAVGTFDMSGEVSRRGASPTLQLTGAGQRRAQVEFAPRGMIRTVQGRDSLAMTATVETVGQSVDLTQVIAYSLTALP